MAKKRGAKVTYTTLFADPSLNPKFESALKAFAKLGKRHPMFIGGKEVWSEAGEFEHQSPIDTSINVGKFQVGTRDHARQSIEAAKAGFQVWSTTPWEKRVRIMEKFARLVDERKFDIAVGITYEVGKNRLEALAECFEAIDAVKFYAKVMRANKGYTERMGQGGSGERSLVHAGQRDGPWGSHHRQLGHPQADERSSPYRPQALSALHRRRSSFGSGQLCDRAGRQLRGRVRLQH
jgi:hypothetical protein